MGDTGVNGLPERQTDRGVLTVLMIFPELLTMVIISSPGILGGWYISSLGVVVLI